MRWRRTARVGFGVFAVAFGVWVAFAFKRREPPTAMPPSVAQTDPNAVVESTGGRLVRYKGTHQDVTVLYEKQLTYANGATKLEGVTVTTQPKSGGRSFVITGKLGEVGENQATIKLDGDVHLKASDGLAAATEHASYTDGDGVVRAPGPATFTQGRLGGSGIGLVYDKNADVLTIADQAVVTQAADAHGTGALSISSGAATIARKDKFIRFERGMHLARGSETIAADNGVATLSEDDKHIQSLDLHGGAHVGGSGTGSGGLQALEARDMNLRYTAGGDALEHVTAIGDAVIRLAGDPGQAGRTISANTLDVALAPDGSTPTALTARDSVQTSFPAENGAAARTIRAQVLEADGAGGHGLTHAQFTGEVQYRERGGTVDRAARSGILDLAVKPGMAAIDEARFARAVRFEEGDMAATAANARYVLAAGSLELTGTEPGAPVPHVVTDRIAIDARRIDVTLAGPKVKASGNVKSVLQPPKKGARSDPKTDTKLPAMLKQDQPVNVTAADLNYDGAAAKAFYTGGSQLWQGETTIKGTAITLDDKTGNLTASGSVATTALFEQEDKKTKKKERVRSIATAKDFNYEDAARKATYTGDVHMAGPQGDVTAQRLELFMKPSGDELDRAEAYEKVTLHEPDRTTTGEHITYTADDELYVVQGAPVKVVDGCGRETVGKTLKFYKAVDTIVVDGNERNRTQTKGGQNCK